MVRPLEMFPQFSRKAPVSTTKTPSFTPLASEIYLNSSKEVNMRKSLSSKQNHLDNHLGKFLQTWRKEGIYILYILDMAPTQ